MQRIWTDYEKSVTLGPIGVGKTTQVRGRLLFDRTDPDDTRVAYVGRKHQPPEEAARGAQGGDRPQPARPTRVPAPAPGRGRARERECCDSAQILVSRDSMHPDVTLEVYSLYGSNLGSRKTIIVFDDLCNFANTLTPDLAGEDGGLARRGAVPPQGQDAHLGARPHLARGRRAAVLGSKEGWYYARYEATRHRDVESGLERPTFPSILPAHRIAARAAGGSRGLTGHGEATFPTRAPRRAAESHRRNYGVVDRTGTP